MSTKNVTIPVRLDPSQTEAIRKCADRFGVTDATVIRWAVDALLKYIELHKGAIHLPVDFTQFWEIAQNVSRPTQLRAAEDPPGTDPPVQHDSRRSVQFEPAPPKKRASQQ